MLLHFLRFIIGKVVEKLPAFLVMLRYILRKLNLCLSILYLTAYRYRCVSYDCRAFMLKVQRVFYAVVDKLNLCELN